MATSVSVTWTRSVVVDGGLTKYRLATVASSAVGITDAAVFVYEKQGSVGTYLHVCTVGDMLHYFAIALPTSPVARRVTFNSAGYTNAVVGDIGKTVAGTNSNGTLLAYNNTDRVWVVAPTASSDTFPAGVAVTIPTGTGAGTTASSTTEDKYRALSVTTDYDTPQDAEDAEALQRTRITNLITDWAATYSTFPGTTTETISA